MPKLEFALLRVELRVTPMPTNPRPICANALRNNMVNQRLICTIALRCNLASLSLSVSPLSPRVFMPAPGLS